MEQKNYNKKVLIISSNFYPKISDNLIKGATKFLESKKCQYEILSVPGSMEIPLFLKKQKNDFGGYIILGCVIKGETDHYEVVKNITLSKIYEFSYENQFPISNALLQLKIILRP